MTAARIVAPLVLLALLGVVVWRVLDRPSDYERWVNGGRR